MKPPQPHHHTRTAGLTLLEIIIAVVLLSFVGAVIISILNSSQQATSETRSQVAQQTTLRTITELIEIDLEQASWGATVSGSNIPKASNGTGARIRLADGSTVTYRVAADGRVYRHDSGTGAERPVAQNVASLEFTANPSARTISVTATPLVDGGGAATAFAIEMTRLVRNP